MSTEGYNIGIFDDEKLDKELSGYPEENEDYVEDAEDYIDGAEVDVEELMEEESFTIPSDASFISDSGEIVVMDTSGHGENFRLEYVDINNIATVNRIRKEQNVADLVKSIKSTGLLMPIVVAPTETDGIYVLLHGLRRLIACAKVGILSIPCIINTKVSTPEIPILEAIYNHGKKYTIKEQIAYIEYLEKQKGIMSASMIEYLLQMEVGDYTKLKDILNDNDDDIVSKLYSGEYSIAQAFKKLEQRRKKESTDVKDLKKAENVYSDEKKSGADNIAGSGEEVSGEALTEEEIKVLGVNAGNIDDGLEDESLDNMVKKGQEIKGFNPKKQDAANREHTDPVIRKSVFVRDGYTCKCCNEGGPSYIDVLEAHHIIPVFLNKGLKAEVAGDVMDNLITLCIKCHKQVHLFSTNELTVPKEALQTEIDNMSYEEKVLYKNEQMKFKRIVKLGTIIRAQMERQGIALEKYKREHPSQAVGKHKPGYRNGIKPEEVANTQAV